MNKQVLLRADNVFFFLMLQFSRSVADLRPHGRWLPQFGFTNSQSLLRFQMLIKAGFIVVLKSSDEVIPQTTPVNSLTMTQIDKANPALFPLTHITPVGNVTAGGLLQKSDGVGGAGLSDQKPQGE